MKKLCAFTKRHDDSNIEISIVNGTREKLATITPDTEIFLEANAGTFDGIICNPPYMRFQKFLKRHDVLPKIEG